MKFYTNVQSVGNNILFRGYENGKLKFKRIPFKPTLYLSGRGGYKSIFGDDLTPRHFDGIKDARAFVKQYKDIDNLEIFGTTDYVAQYIQENWPNDVEFDESLINTLFIDIEVNSDAGFPEPADALHPIDAITIRSTKSGRYLALSLYDYDPRKSQLKLSVPIEHIKFESEQQLIRAFIELWNTEEFSPDIVTGWNSRGFDIPYIINRIIRLFGEAEASKLSPWKKLEKRHVEVKGFEMEVWEILGVSSIDLMDAFKKFGHKYGPQESYSLNHISHVILDEKKLSYEEYGSLFNLAAKNPQLYVDYNIKDTDLVYRIEEKTKLISLIMTMTYQSGVNFNDTFGTTKIWDTIIYRRLVKDKVIVQPNKSKAKGSYEGAYVKEPIKGKYKWVMSFDLNSLYPNIIAQYNMSPETYVRDQAIQLSVDKCLARDVPKLEYSIAPNGSLYRKDIQGVVPQIIIEYYNRRKALQKKQYKLEEQLEIEKDPKVKAQLSGEIDRIYNRQMSIKLLLNSFYGALANAYFRHFELMVAEGITMGGQLTIKWAERAINEYLNKALKTDSVDYVIAIDTDSVYINFEPLINHVKPANPVEFLEELGDTVIAKVFEKAFKELFEQQNAYTNRMWMGREVIASSGFWTGKKKYALAVMNKDGITYSEPKVKITGLSAIQSSTPAPCRKWLKDIFMIILEGDQASTVDFIEKCREEFNTLGPEDIARNSSVSEITKYIDKAHVVKKGTPINTRASILYNKAILDGNLNHIYQYIKEGEKMKYVYMTLPNPLKQNVMGFKDIFPRELNYDKYIDYNTQFEKVFLAAVDPIMEAVGWRHETTMDLDAFFV